MSLLVAIISTPAYRCEETACPIRACSRKPFRSAAITATRARPIWRARPARANSPASSSSTICRDGTSGSRRWSANSPITALRPSRRTSTSATARATRTISGRACGIADLDAVVDCWGGNVVVDDKSQLNAKRPVVPIDLTEQLRAPLLGIFGNDDQNPNADQVNRTEATLRRLGKTYEFHRYDGAGHAFFNTSRVAYRPEQAADGWAKTFAFLRKTLAA